MVLHGLFEITHSMIKIAQISIGTPLFSPVPYLFGTDNQLAGTPDSDKKLHFRNFLAFSKYIRKITAHGFSQTTCARAKKAVNEKWRENYVF